MKDKKIVDAYARIKPSYYAKQRVWNKITAPKRNQQRRKLPVFATIAVMLALLVFAHSFLPAQLANSFTVRVYAMERQADGTIAGREIDLVNQTGTWGGFHDGENLYLNISLEVEGENLESVEFRLENGFFAKQYYEPRTGQNGSDGRTLYIGDEHGNLGLAVLGTEFERLGSQIALHDVQADNLLLFVAVPTEMQNTPESIEVQVQVVFHDGEIQTEAFTLNFGNRMGVIIGDLPVFELEPKEFNSIDLSELTLIPESVTTLVAYDDVYNVWGGAEMYVWRFENGSTFFASKLDFEETDIDIRGMARIGGSAANDGDIVLAVIKLVDGDLVGMEYLVPPAIASEFGF